jgi:hypothetical protein
MPRRKRQPTAISYQVEPGSQWWAYARHSPGTDQTIGSQRQAIEFAAHDLTITRWFVDEAESGSSLGRDQFTDMVEASGILSPEPPRPEAARTLVLNCWSRPANDPVLHLRLPAPRLAGGPDPGAQVPA